MGVVSASDYPAEMLKYVEPGHCPNLSSDAANIGPARTCSPPPWSPVGTEYWEQFRALSGLLRNAPDRPSSGITEVISLLLGVSADAYLDSISIEGERKRAQAQIQSLEHEVGLNIYEFVEQFADAAAFSEFAKKHVCSTPYGGDGDLRVYPASSVIRQDRRTLTTSATATTLVTGKPVALGIATDPQAWEWSSDVIKRACYVRDPFGSDAQSLSEPLGMGFEGFRLLKEDAVFAWGRRSDERSSFSNVLNVEHKVAHPGPRSAKDQHQVLAVPQYRQFCSVGPPFRWTATQSRIHEGQAGRAGHLAGDLAQTFAFQRPHALRRCPGTAGPGPDVELSGAGSPDLVGRERGLQHVGPRIFRACGASSRQRDADR